MEISGNNSWLSLLKIILQYGFVLLLLFYIDRLEEIPYSGPIALFLILGYASYQIYKLVTKNKKYANTKFLLLPHEDDRRNKIFNIILGVILSLTGITFFLLANEKYTLWTLINTSLLGFYLLTLAIIRKNTVVLELKKNLIKSHSNTSTINSDDKKIVFRKGQIEIIKEDLSITTIPNLDLDFTTVPEICSWINANLKTNELKFYRATQSEIEEIISGDNIS